MMKKIIGIIICTLLIATSVYPVIAITNILNPKSSEMNSLLDYCPTKHSDLEERDTIDVWMNMSPSVVGGTLYQRKDHDMVYDSQADRTIMFGGITAGMRFNDTWEYNYTANTWYKKNPDEIGGTLTPRYGIKMVYDSQADRTIMFAGNIEGSETWVETWVYNFNTNTWYNMTPNVVGDNFYLRTLHAMAYDSNADRTIMFGGARHYDSMKLNDTWEYNFNTNTWYNMTPNVVGGTLTPRQRAAMVYDPQADRTIMFGGTHRPQNDCQLNETWVYNYTDNTWYKMNPSVVGGTLAVREEHTMVYDSQADRTIMFGGWTSDCNGNGWTLNDTWEYDFNTNTWYNMTPIVVGGTLFARELHAMSYDSQADRTIMFGGSGLRKDTWTFIKNLTNQAPNIPVTPSGPTQLIVDESGTYNTSAVDPDGDQLQYRFDWDANGSHDYSSWTDLVPSGTQASLSHSWDTGGPYVVKAQARDIYEYTSEWSNGLSIYIESPPNSPSNPNPSDGATDVDINADLSWTCSDPDGDELTFDVYFEADDPTPDELVSNNQSENWYDPGTMEYNTNYYWRIVAWDETGLSTTGPIWDFTTGSEPNDPPDPPSDPDPADGATDVSIDADLSWICSDPDGDEIFYDVYLEADDETPDVLVADDITETTFDPGNLDYGTVYYWQIIAKDEHSATTTGPVWSFTTIVNNPPSAPTVSGPTSGKPGQLLTFTFNSVDPEGHDVRFLIDWGDGESETTSFTGSGNDMTASHAWSAKGTYTLTVKAEDEYGAISFETSGKITIPRNKALNNPFLNWLQGYPYLFSLLQKLIQQLGFGL